MASHDPDKEMFDAVKEGIKNLSDILSTWQQKESALHSMAEANAKSSGATPEDMDAHVYMHKKMLKKAMADHAKMMEQGGQGTQGVQGGQTGGQGGPGMAPLTQQVRY